MMAGLDHIALEVPDVAAAAADYAALLGRTPVPAGRDAPAPHARFALENTAVLLVPPPAGSSPLGAALRARLVLAATDLKAAAHRLQRRGLAGRMRAAGDVFDLDPTGTHGVLIGITQWREPLPAAAPPVADISGLDHVVIRTPDPERAVALYGGRLGLDLRLDRTNADLASRMLFFVAGGLVIEITHDTRKGTGPGPDRIFGLAWRARDLEAANARMRTAGIDVSEVRTGRRPGTRVFTARSHTAGLPTLVIGGDGLERS